MAVWTPQAREEIIERALGGLNPMGSEYRKLSRYHQGNSFEVELDSTGRVTLPGSLLAHAGVARRSWSWGWGTTSRCGAGRAGSTGNGRWTPRSVR